MWWSVEICLQYHRQATSFNRGNNQAPTNASTQDRQMWAIQASQLKQEAQLSLRYTVTFYVNMKLCEMLQKC